MIDKADGVTPIPLARDDDSLLTGTPAFDALFAALERAAVPADMTYLGLLLGSSISTFA